MTKQLVILALAILSLTGCVGKKKFVEMQGSRDALQQELSRLQSSLRDCETRYTTATEDLRRKDQELAARQNQISSLEQQLGVLQNTNANLLDRLSDLSVISQQGAESIKKSLDALDRQNQYIRDLNSRIQSKDSLNLVLVQNLKRSLGDINDQDVQVEVRKGVVYISISDKMLFNSGSDAIKPQAETVLSKVARVINDHKSIEILVEGHTDNVPIANTVFRDNWDLSVRRATSVVRSLQTKYGVDPKRMTAGGRGEHAPKDTNATDAGRSRNRRTEIIVTPDLEQFFSLLTPQEGGQ